MDLEGDEIHIEVHCAPDEIMTKNGIKAQIEIRGLLRGKIGELGKAKTYLMGNSNIMGIAGKVLC